jgi:hypothetical protein
MIIAISRTVFFDDELAYAYALISGILSSQLVVTKKHNKNWWDAVRESLEVELQKVPPNQAIDKMHMHHTHTPPTHPPTHNWTWLSR